MSLFLPKFLVLNLGGNPGGAFVLASKLTKRFFEKKKNNISLPKVNFHKIKKKE